MRFLPPRSPCVFTSFICLAGSIAALWQPEVSAQSLSWDPNLAVAGAQGGSGDWDGGAFWWNGTSNQAWLSGSDATFGATSGTVDADGITVDDISVVSLQSY